MMKRKFGEKDMQLLVSNILRIGVYTSLGIVAIGLLLYLVQQRGSVTDYGTFSMAEGVSAADVWHKLCAGEPKSIITIGVLLLMVTPIVRIIIALLGFWLEKDRLYVMIALIILIIIAGSMYLGAVG
jgi:uncharacterized membrane protein